MSAGGEATASAPTIPFVGFRLVFALINGAIWFALVFGITSAISMGVVAAGRLTPVSVVVFAGVVGFFVSFFGLSGAISGFLDQARSGRFLLPSETEWGPRRLLASIWLHGLWRGVATSAAAVGLGLLYVQRAGVPSRNTLCLALAGMAAAFAVLQSALLARPKTLGDLRPETGPAPSPSSSYYLRRFALPHGAGNALINGLVAWGTFPQTADGSPGVVPAGLVAVDALTTTLVVATFMVVSSGGLAGTDRLLGRISGIGAPPPSRLARVGFMMLAALSAAAIGYALASVGGPRGLPVPAMVAWKGALGGVVAGVFAAQAARWRISGS